MNAAEFQRDFLEKILAVGLEHGFYDHSHFTREFTRIVGLTPGAYREQCLAAQLTHPA